MRLPSLFQFPPPMLLEGIHIEPEEARSILRPQKDEHLGMGYTLSPYRGCAHGCKYCYVREYPHPLHQTQPWGGWIVPKLNAPELLWQQRHRLHDQSVFLSTATDPYQPIEKEYRLTHACLDILQRLSTTRVIVHTRSPLVLQDLELLQSFKDRIKVCISIPTDDDTVRQVVEPKAPAIPSRWATLERLVHHGIPTQMAVTPLLPMVDPNAFARRARDSGITQVWVGGLRLLKNDPFYTLLAEHDWLKALDPNYISLIREILLQTLPAASCSKNKKNKPKSRVLGLPKRVLCPSSPMPVALFEGLSFD